jgi:hypothetical protein
MGPKQSWLGWVRPFCKWAFEIAYKVDADDVNMTRFAGVMRNKPALLIDEAGDTAASGMTPTRVKQVVQFLRKNLVARPRATASLLQREAVGAIRIDEGGMPNGGAGGEAWPPQKSAEDLLQRAKNTGW